MNNNSFFLSFYYHCFYSCATVCMHIVYKQYMTVFHSKCFKYTRCNFLSRIIETAKNFKVGSDVNKNYNKCKTCVLKTFYLLGVIINILQ